MVWRVLVRGARTGAERGCHRSAGGGPNSAWGDGPGGGQRGRGPRVSRRKIVQDQEGLGEAPGLLPCAARGVGTAGHGDGAAGGGLS